jgi:hypothetical protein
MIFTYKRGVTAGYYIMLSVMPLRFYQTAHRVIKSRRIVWTGLEALLEEMYVYNTSFARKVLRLI